MLGIIVIVFAIVAIQQTPWAQKQSRDSGSTFGVLLAVAVLLVLTFLISVISLKGTLACMLLLAMFGIWKSFVLKFPSKSLSIIKKQSGQFMQSSWIVQISIGTMFCINLLTLISAFAPVTSWDATVAHIALPADYWRIGNVELIAGNAYSGYPQYLHAMYSVLYGFSGETAAALLSWSMGPLGCFVVYALGKKLGTEETGYIGGAIFSSAPIVAQQAGTVSIDLTFAVLTLGVWLFWLHAIDDKKRVSYLYAAALLAGISCGVRHTGFIVCAFMALITFIEFRKQWIPCGLVIGLMFVGALPSLVFTWVNTGNPFYPLLAEIFVSPELPDIQDTRIGAHETVRGNTGVEFLLYPWYVVMQPGKFDGWSGSPGGLTLILGIPAIFIGARASKYIGAFALFPVWFFYFFQRLARYVFPFLAPLAALAALTYTSLPKYRRPLSLLIAMHFILGVSVAAGGMYFKIPVALGMESREAYLTERVERYAAFQWVNETLPEDAVVMTFDIRSSYIERATYPNLEILFTLREMDKKDLMIWFRQQNIKYIFYPEAYVKESPVFAARGLVEVLDSWRNDIDHFTILHSMELKRPRSTGTETVEIWEVLWDEGPSNVSP